MNKKLFHFLAIMLLTTLPAILLAAVPSPELSLFTKEPGNPVEGYDISRLNTQNYIQVGNLKIKRDHTAIGPGEESFCYIFTALDDIAFHCRFEIPFEKSAHEHCEFLLPGLWYKRNLNITEGAPSISVSDSWLFREDRLSTPLSAAFDTTTGNYLTVIRADRIEEDALTAYPDGDVIQYGHSDVGSLGFAEKEGKTRLIAAYPVCESPFRYSRKLTLDKNIRVFRQLNKGESVTVSYRIVEGHAPTYSDFIRIVWQYAYDLQKPQPIKPQFNSEEVKSRLTKFYEQSYTDEYPLKGYSGVELDIDKCENRGLMEVGFVGRNLLNAYYALKYGEQTKNEKLATKARSIFDSYLEHGFSPNGFFREIVDYRNGREATVYSIRRQSEGAFAILYYLEYERLNGRNHPHWEKRIQTLLNKFLALQNTDGSFPRKFRDNMEMVDSSGGSSSCAVLPLSMASKYWKDRRYYNAAVRTADYMKHESVEKGVYFSSTLDARCEDKEASLYIATAYYYLWLASGKQQESYIDNALKSTYFALTYYYTWDVPFAPGQMLGDLGFKSRGWGNVSVENNHIDVYVFEFADILEWLTVHRGDMRLEKFSCVIRSSMQDQLLPVAGRMCGIGRESYYPEVVQHTAWDYGCNGKGYYNNIFAPGWVVASLWTMLSPGNAEAYFNK